MKYIAISLAFLINLFLSAQELSLNATNTVWYKFNDRSSFELPQDPTWEIVTNQAQFITPEFTESSGITLKDYEIAVEPLPRMLPIKVYSPAGGVVREGEREVSRYIEFVDELAQTSDNIIEYQLALEGGYTLDPKYRRENWLIEFRSGHENWVELIHNGKVLAEGKSQVIVKGSDIPTSGEMQIRCSSWRKDNKGIISITAFKAYERFIPDRFHKGPDALLSKDQEWAYPTTKIFQSLKVPMDKTPVLYKRTYICKTSDDTKNVVLHHDKNVTSVFINGQNLKMGSNMIPDGVLREGENEVIYYSTHLSNNLNRNIYLYKIKPFFLRTTVKATKNSVVKINVRGARSQVIINGKFAGMACPEKPHEALGLGLFQEGENEIMLCLLQHSQKTFLESVNIATPDSETALILPWYTEKGSPMVHYGSGPAQPYEGAVLSSRKDMLYKTSFKLEEIPVNDIQLVFNSVFRLPSWVFTEEMTAPYSIKVNGTQLIRRDHSFIIPAKILKKENQLLFKSDGATVPEPVLYLSAQESKAKAATGLKLLKRAGREIICSNKYFTGENLTYKLLFNPDAVTSIQVKIDGKESIVNPAKFEVQPTINLTFEEQKNYKLDVTFKLKDEKIKEVILSKEFEVKAFPENVKGWLRANGQVQTLIISDSAFFESESMLFPGSFPQEWLHRELYSDRDDLHFGPIRVWNAKQKFSIYDSLPNGQAVFAKFYKRLNSYLKIKSQGLPTRFILKAPAKPVKLWESAAFSYQYLKWLESNNTDVDWRKNTLKDLQKVYVDGIPEKANFFITNRVNLINQQIKKMALEGAPGSTFEEEEVK